MNILFTCAGRRNYLINYFKEALGSTGKVFAADFLASSPAMAEAHKSFVVPGIYDDNYLPVLEEIIINNNICAIVPLNDLELPLLAENKKRFKELGCVPLVSEKGVIDICFDKILTFKFLEKNQLRSPKTFDSLETVIDAVSKNYLGFPLVVKPRWGSASIGIEFPETVEELEIILHLQRLRLGRSILQNAIGDNLNRSIIIQEKLSGKEYGMDVLNDLEGNYIGSFAREKIAMRSGETDKAVSVIIPELEKIGESIGKYLRHIGNLDCDVFEHNGKFYVLEMNPRFGGGYPFSHEAGVNTAAIYIEWLSGKSNISKFVCYQAGVAHSKCDRLIKLK